MKLFLLRPKPIQPDIVPNPWSPWFDKAFGHVIRAPSEEAAREYAHNLDGDENTECSTIPAPWKDPEYSTCVELTPAGEPGVIITDFYSA